MRIAPSRRTTQCSSSTPSRTVSAEEARQRGWVQDASALVPGDQIALPYHPFGTDYLGRDMLARLVYGARVSLFIGVVAPMLFVLTGIVYGSAAGFMEVAWISCSCASPISSLRCHSSCS